MTPYTITVHVLACGECGHQVTGLHVDTVKAAMLEHLVYCHNGATV